MAISYRSYSPVILVRRAFGAWAAMLFGLTCVAVIYLNITEVNPDLDFSPAAVLMAYSPSLAALLVAMLVPASGGVPALLRQIGRWRVHIKWYAIALFGPPLLVVAATLVYIVLGGTSSRWLALPDPQYIPLLLGPLIAGTLGEELGWRGFGQHLLQKRYSVLLASIVVGFLWATWNSWPMLAPGGEAYADPWLIAEGYVRLIAMSIIYGWLYVRTKGSLLIIMLAHAGHILAISLVPASLLNTTMPLIIAGLYCLVAASIAVSQQDLLKRRA